MSHPTVLSSPDLEKLKAFDSCTISNAIERLNVRLRSEGFLSGWRAAGFRSSRRWSATQRPEFAPGLRRRPVAVTTTAWIGGITWPRSPNRGLWPRRISINQPGLGAFVGEIHAAIGVALSCVGCVTNGAVRDLPAVEIDSLKIKSGDLLHGDRHGIVAIPLSIATKVPKVASDIQRQERELIEFCSSPRFSLEGLSERIQNMNLCCDLPWSGAE